VRRGRAGDQQGTVDRAGEARTAPSDEVAQPGRGTPRVAHAHDLIGEGEDEVPARRIGERTPQALAAPALRGGLGCPGLAEQLLGQRLGPRRQVDASSLRKCLLSVCTWPW
jgi:hypothetical protein